MPEREREQAWRLQLVGSRVSLQSQASEPEDAEMHAI